MHAAEFVGISYTKVIKKVALRVQRPTDVYTLPAAIFSGSNSAFQATLNLGTKAAQQIIHTIPRAAKNKGTHGTVIHLQWIPGDCETPDNNAED